jgi:hypothetical protein
MVPPDPVFYPSQFDNLRDSWDDAIKAFHGAAGRMDQFGCGMQWPSARVGIAETSPQEDWGVKT